MSAPGSVSDCTVNYNNLPLSNTEPAPHSMCLGRLSPASNIKASVPSFTAAALFAPMFTMPASLCAAQKRPRPFSPGLSKLGCVVQPSCSHALCCFSQ